MPRQSHKTIEASIFTAIETWAYDRSKDPITKVGACVYDYETGGMYLGYNGLPRGIADTEARWEKPFKYQICIHGEINALLKALPAVGYRIRECVMFTTLEPCSNCMLLIIQTGIRKVVYLNARPDPLSASLALEAGVEVTQYRP